MSTLERAAQGYQTARTKLEDEIRRAKSDGESLRAIATQVGWSHEQVRKVILRGTR